MLETHPVQCAANGRDYLRTTDLAQLVGEGARTIRRKAASGKIPSAFLFGDGLRFRFAITPELKKWIARERSILARPRKFHVGLRMARDRFDAWSRKITDARVSGLRLLDNEPLEKWSARSLEFAADEIARLGQELFNPILEELERREVA